MRARVFASYKSYLNLKTNGIYRYAMHLNELVFGLWQYSCHNTNTLYTSLSLFYDKTGKTCRKHGPFVNLIKVVSYQGNFPQAVVVFQTSFSKFGLKSMYRYLIKV